MRANCFFLVDEEKKDFFCNIFALKENGPVFECISVKAEEPVLMYATWHNLPADISRLHLG